MPEEPCHAGTGCYPAREGALANGLAEALAGLAEAPAADPRPLEVLSLSGGVLGTPFTAGALVGWTASGTRPVFDVVTGISSGALIGAYAFLGPKYDPDLERLVLTLNGSDLVKVRPLHCFLFDGAFASAAPAERLIRTEVNDRFLADLRQAHLEGRHFLVGTMNLQTRRLVVWDVGAIASSGRPDAGDLVRKVLLAAIAWPGLVPPVEFDAEVKGRRYHEQHYDGGTVAMAFVPLGPLPEWPRRGPGALRGCPAGSNLYVVPCRKLYSEAARVPKRALDRALVSMSATLAALTRADIVRMYSLCHDGGIRFHLLALPQDYHDEPLSLWDPYPRQARQLFETGYRLAGRGPPWRHTPPGDDPDVEAVPGARAQIETRR